MKIYDIKQTENLEVNDYAAEQILGGINLDFSTHDINLESDNGKVDINLVLEGSDKFSDITTCFFGDDTYPKKSQIKLSASVKDDQYSRLYISALIGF